MTGCGYSPISHRLQFARVGSFESTSCGYSPISHRLQYEYVCITDRNCCGYSPISHRLQCGATTTRGSVRCGYSPISHRLQSTVHATMRQWVAVTPRSPIGYNDRVISWHVELVAVTPRSPIGYNGSPVLFVHWHVAVTPRSPIGYNPAGFVAVFCALRLLPDLPSATIWRRLRRSSMGCGYSPISHRLQFPTPRPARLPVAVTPRSPIGYNLIAETNGAFSVAVTPRSPIGYNLAGSSGRYYQLRLLPDLPSATIQPPSKHYAKRCGYSPISHRLQFRPSSRSWYPVAVTPRSPIGYNLN